MNNRIISKCDIEILQSAAEILKRLGREHDVRLNNFRKSSAASTYQEYWNARRKYYYFTEACGKHNIDYRPGYGCMVLLG